VHYLATTTKINNFWECEKYLLLGILGFAVSDAVHGVRFGTVTSYFITVAMTVAG